MTDDIQGLVAGGGNGSRIFLCVSCRSFVTSSDRILALDGKKRHRFVNPVGVACEFYTFASSPGAIHHGDATAEHSWFPGYRWRFAFCAHCHHHLGWHYSAIHAFERPLEFWGLLIAHLVQQ